MIICLYGQDTYRSGKHLQKLRTRFQKEVDPTGSSIVEIDGRDLDMAYLRKVVLAPSLFVKSRFVILKNVLETKPSKELQQSIIELLEEYAVSPSAKATSDQKIKTDFDQQNILVFWEQKSKKELNVLRVQKLLFEFLIKQKFSQEFELLSLIQLRNWVIKKCEFHQTKIDRDALKDLLNIAGNNMWRLASELDKLIAYRYKKVIRVADIKLLVINELEEDLYKLLDLITLGNISESLANLSHLLISPDNRQGVFHTLKWHLNSIASIKRSIEQGIVSDVDIAKLTSLHPYVIKKNKAYANKLSISVLEKLLKRVTELEIDIRKNPKLENLFLSRFVFGLSIVSKKI